MASRKKILWIGDVNKSTGLGQAFDNIAPRILRENKYELVVIGINYRGDTRDSYGCKIYQCDSQDVYGFQMFPGVVMNERPDLIFIVHDEFAHKIYTDWLRQNAPQIPVIIFFPQDSCSVPVQYMDALRYATIPIVFSKYGYDTICHRFPEFKGKLRYIHFGVNTDIFRPLPKEREEIRKLNNVSDKFVVGMVNRFNPRKMLPLGIRAFSLMFHGYDKCKCGNYYLSSLDQCDLNFCPKSDVIETVKPKKNMVLYLHCNLEDSLMGGNTNTLYMSAESAGLKESDQAIMTPGVDTLGPMAPDKVALNRVYQMLDVHLVVDAGEGLGITQLESLAAGIPLIKSNNTTAPELVSGYATMVDNCSFFSMGNDASCVRPVVSIPSVVKALEKFYANWVVNGTVLSDESHKYIVNNFNWNKKYQEFSQAISEALATKKTVITEKKVVDV